MSDFELYAEAVLGRYQQAGLREGDYVKLKGGYEKHECFKDSPDILAKLKSFIESGLNIKVLGLKGGKVVHNNQNVATSSDLPFSWTADIATEWTRGLTGGQDNVVTVPTDILEVSTYAGDVPPIPDAWKYKGKTGVEYPKTEL